MRMNVNAILTGQFPGMFVKASINLHQVDWSVVWEKLSLDRLLPSQAR
jgi:hypothetical protein